MKRSSFDDEKPLPPHGAMGHTPRLPCRQCHDATLVSMLSQYGGWCLVCYEAYCEEGSSQRRKLTPQERREAQAKLEAMTGASRARAFADEVQP
jgi:hypothetical protein